MEDLEAKLKAAQEEIAMLRRKKSSDALSCSPIARRD